MIGAIIGDIVGSRYEWNNIKTKDFTLFDEKCRVTDDSVMTVAIAKAILDCNCDYGKLSNNAIVNMQSFGKKYPNAGYGKGFEKWIKATYPEPYNSFGNGAAMRVSACAYAANSIEEVVKLAQDITRVTHNHIEGIKGAEAVAVATFLALHGECRERIKEYIEENYYAISFSLDEIRGNYKFDSSCQGSVPQALEAFFESDDFEDAIRNAVSIGGDSDTIAAITGSVAGAYYVIPDEIKETALGFLPDDLLTVYNAFKEVFDPANKYIDKPDNEENYVNSENHLDIEGAIERIDSDAFNEESQNVESNYKSIADELSDEKDAIPFPDIHPYDTANNYDEISDLQYMKSKNKPHWDAIEVLREYDECESLYVGHLSYKSESEFFIMENPFLSSRTLKNGAHLLNSDDKAYTDIINAWRFPDKDKHANYSCNLGIEKKKLQYVDVQLNRENELYADITDAYLRNALIRNKSKAGINSIIQTIQKKQNAIRSLPVNSSFVVQGCAGSGKTMVLLHRLRYLIYNGEMQGDQYVVLLPEKSLKETILQVSRKFNINSRNLKTYQEYYKELSGRTRDDNEEANELVFSQDYLREVYSEEFIRSCYDSFIRDILKKSEELIDDCESVLNELVQKEKDSINANIKAMEKSLLDRFNTMCEPFFLDNKLTELSLIPDAFCKMEDEIEQVKELAKLAQIDESAITIDPNDERIINHQKLASLREDIAKASESVKKASFFTANSHRKKLDQLKELYEIEYKKVETTCIQEEIQKLKNEQRKFATPYCSEELEQVLKDCKQFYDVSVVNIEKEKKKINDFESFFASKYANEIQELNELIELSEDFYYNCESDIDSLSAPIHFVSDSMIIGSIRKNVVEEYIRKASLLLKIIADIIADENERTQLVKKHVLFNNKTGAQLSAYLTTRLFNITRKKIRDKYNKTLNPIYKHYWYLYLYSLYLTRGSVDDGHKYIFIDEAQDLSVSEHNLLRKVNVKNNSFGEFMIADTIPVINLFGDVNQTISSFGIKDWKEIEYLTTHYTLDENFRNTNQIIDFCNDNLGIKMTKVGVDLNEVDSFEDVVEAQNKMNLSGKTYIVKDECALEDFKVLMSKRGISHYEVMTVKGAKGLEFREVVVVQRDMHESEKYIAYTRALQKLYVINNLPHYTAANKDYSVEGSELGLEDETA